MAKNKKTKHNGNGSGLFDQPKTRKELAELFILVAKDAGAVLKVKDVKGDIHTVSLSEPGGKAIRSIQIDMAPKKGIDVIEEACQKIKDAITGESGNAARGKQLYGKKLGGQKHARP